MPVLPWDIVFLIADVIDDLETSKNLRLTCKEMADYTARHTFREVSFVLDEVLSRRDFWKATVAVRLEMFQRPQIHPHVRRVMIHLRLTPPLLEQGYLRGVLAPLAEALCHSRITTLVLHISGFALQERETIFEFLRGNPFPTTLETLDFRVIYRDWTLREKHVNLAHLSHVPVDEPRMGTNDISALTQQVSGTPALAGLPHLRSLRISSDIVELFTQQPNCSLQEIVLSSFMPLLSPVSEQKLSQLFISSSSVTHLRSDLTTGILFNCLLFLPNLQRLMLRCHCSVFYEKMGFIANETLPGGRLERLRECIWLIYGNYNERRNGDTVEQSMSALMLNLGMVSSPQFPSSLQSITMATSMFCQMEWDCDMRRSSWDVMANSQDSTPDGVGTH